MSGSASELLVFNGLDGSTGEYLVPPMTPEQLASIARGERLEPDERAELAWRGRQAEAHFAVREGIDATDLAQAGWGVIFPATADARIKDALGELLAHRRRLAGGRYREYEGPTGYRPDDTKNRFLSRLGIGPGPVDPDRVPYYLLIVGDPESIPYGFQSQLDVAYAVGRIAFDTLDEYARYAHSVVQAETTGLALPRGATFWGTRNDGDGATELSAAHLVAPLAAAIASDRAAWSVRTILGEDATRARLARLAGGDETPALLFTASHGIGFARGDPLQRERQGALVCQDWPGPLSTRGRPFSSEWTFGGRDVSDGARPFGLVAMHFACFGAGTPRHDEFAHLRGGARERTEIAPAGFVAALPRRLLSHPNGGALAVIGHVERAWGSSFVWERAGDQLAVFESTLLRIMDGQPVGHAVDPFNARYAELAVDLSSTLEDIGYGATADPLTLSGLWTANNDARGYSIVGDPAVRLVVGDDAPSERPTVTLVRTAAPVPDAANPGATTSAAPVAATPAAYGWLDGSAIGELQQQLTAGIRDLIDRLTTTMGRVVDDATSLEVRTYTSEDLAGVRYETGGIDGATLRAVTRMDADGDTVACVPEVRGRVDSDLWKVHLDVVTQARENRTELLGVAASAAAALVNALRGGG
jgi:hypothetical protein